MKTYTGYRDSRGACHVYIINNGVRKELPLRLDLDNHSPTGFEWGYGGSGPAQLALAILADALNDGALAVRLHQDFKWETVSRLDRNKPWTYDHRQVIAIANRLNMIREKQIVSSSSHPQTLPSSPGV